MIDWSPRFLFYFTPLIWAVKDISWRFGRRFRCTEPDMERILGLASPGMVVLSRREYQFTNLFIDGHWTHSAMILPEGRIIESTTHGVVIRDIRAFLLSVDDFVILKPRFCGCREMEQASRHATEIIGAPYCFDFNNSDRDYYCSKLVLKAYERSCSWDPANGRPPGEYRTLCAGRIVHPSDLYRNGKAWEIVYQMN
jgi:hypothetical protein